MANQEAYLSDLDDLRKEIDYLLSMVPIGKSRGNSKRGSRLKTRPAEPEPRSAA